MSIQGQFNQALGAAAAAAYTIGTEKEKAAEQYDLAAQQKADAEGDVKNLQAEQITANESLKEKQAAYDALMAKKPGGKGNTKEALEEKQRKALTEIQASQLAFDALADKIEARQAMISRAEKIMKRSGKWGGMR